MNARRRADRLTPLTVEAPSTRAPAHRVRATALPPEERRAAIVAATVPLLLAYGPSVSTRQIAEAAGVAEGTIFRVFPDKEAVVAAAVEAACDPAPIEAALRSIDLSLPLEQRLTIAVGILQRRMTGIWQLLTVLGHDKHPPGHAAHPAKRHPRDSGALAALFEPDRQLLGRDPAAAAQLLRGLTIAGTHPAIAGDEPLDPAEIVSVLLDGIRIPAGCAHELTAHERATRERAAHEPPDGEPPGGEPATGEPAGEGPVEPGRRRRAVAGRPRRSRPPRTSR